MLGGSSATTVRIRKKVGKHSITSVKRMTAARPTRAAVVAGEAAERDADRERDRDRDEADRERDERALQHAREDVAAELVGAEQVDAERRQVGGGDAAPARAGESGGSSLSGSRTTAGSNTTHHSVSSLPSERHHDQRAQHARAPAIARRSRRNARHTSPERRSARGGERPGARVPAATAQPQPDARIDDRVEHVREERARERQHRGDEVERQDHREVARQDRVVAEPAEAGPGEDLLDDHRAADQARDQQSRTWSRRAAARCGARGGRRRRPRAGPWRARCARSPARPPRASASARSATAPRCRRAPRSATGSRGARRGPSPRHQGAASSIPKVRMPITGTWKVVHHPEDHEVGEEEARERDQRVGRERGGAVEERAAPRAPRGCRAGTRGVQLISDRDAGTAAPSSGSAPRSFGSTGWPSLNDLQLAGEQIAHPVAVLRGRAARRGGRPRGCARCPRGFIRGFIGSTWLGSPGARCIDGVGEHRDHERAAASRCPSARAQEASPCSAPRLRTGDRSRACASASKWKVSWPVDAARAGGCARRRPRLALDDHDLAVEHVRGARREQEGVGLVARRSGGGAACASSSCSLAVVLHADPLDQPVRLGAPVAGEVELRTDRSGSSARSGTGRDRSRRPTSRARRRRTCPCSRSPSRNTVHSKTCAPQSTPSFRHASWAIGHDRLALGVAVVRDQREREALAVLLRGCRPGPRAPARLARAAASRPPGRRAERRLRVVEDSCARVVGPETRSPFAVEHVVDELVDVDRHARARAAPARPGRSAAAGCSAM